MRKQLFLVIGITSLLGGCLEVSTDAASVESAEVSNGTATIEAEFSAEWSASSNVSTGSQVGIAQSIYNLGPCNAATEGASTYVIDESSYFFCSSGLWAVPKETVTNSCSITGSGDGNIVICGDVTIGNLTIGGSTGSALLDSSIQAIVGKDGKDGVDGKDGKDGIDGKDGRDGVDGIDGIDGVDGKDGRDGKDGIDGVDGKDGKDGSSCTVAPLPNNAGYKILCGGDSVGVLLNGRDGVDGKDGCDGKDGRDGVDGKDGRDGVDGRDGRDGIDGVDGKDGKDGRDGIDGKDGRDGIDGVDGKDGKDGRDGIDGKDGRDGVDGKDGRDGVDGKNCDCDSTKNLTKESWSALNPNLDYCVFQDARDSQWYKCVVIGNQTWMAENLNYASTATQSWCYDNQDSNCTRFGRLYTWSAAADLPETYNNKNANLPENYQGACPAGWHLPTNAEWNVLHAYVSVRNSYVGQALLSKEHGGTDEFGFSAVPAGNWKDDLVDRQSYFDNTGWVADFWSATEDNYMAIRRNIGYYNETSLNAEYEEKYEWGYSVRCVKN